MEVLYSSIYLSRLFSLWINDKVNIICRKQATNEEKVWRSTGAKKMYFLAHILSQVERVICIKRC